MQFGVWVLFVNLLSCLVNEMHMSVECQHIQFYCLDSRVLSPLIPLLIRLVSSD